MDYFYLYAKNPQLSVIDPVKINWPSKKLFFLILQLFDHAGLNTEVVGNSDGMALVDGCTVK